ncbi:MAG: ATP-binding protein [Anaerolineae bacterium]|nr:ATP-binding protein [Anaerolineae bacterium]
MSTVDRNPELQFLLKVIRSTSEGGSGSEVLQQLVHLVRVHWDPEAVSIARVETGGGVTFCAASGGCAEQVVGLHLASGAGIVGWVTAHAQPLWIPDVTVDARFCPHIDRRTGFNTRSILGVPMIVRGEARGVLEFINPAPETDMQTVGDLVEAIALLAAPIIDNVELSERVRDVEIRYQRLFDLNLDPIVVLSNDGQWLEVNQAAQSLLGLCGEEPSGFDLSRMGTTVSAFGELSREARDTGVVTWEFSSPGQDRVMEARLLHLPDYQPDGGYLWTGHDITCQVDRARARQELMQMVVHDLRTPLGGIRNSMELVLAAWLERDETMPIEQILGIGLRMARRMEQLTSDMLDSARLNANEGDLALVAIDVKAMVDEAVETVISSVKRRDQKLSVHLAPEITTLNGDANLLRRVIVNLLANAVKYNRDGGEARIDVSVDDDEMLFSVIDNGYGIAPDLRDHVFELYVRGGSRITRGAGIGLRFCKLAVEAHGGRIWLQSEVEQGASFTFAIPRTLPLSVEDRGEAEQ